MHLPSTQVSPAGHVSPHPPQLAASFAVSTQVPRHRIVPGRQTQAPRTHSAPAPHATSHRPQCAVLLWGFTQAPPQRCSGAVHVTPPPALVVASHQPATSSTLPLRNCEGPSWWKYQRLAEGSTETPHMSPRLVNDATLVTARFETRTREMVFAFAT